MIITIASNKGGVGKTTTAIHLAAYLQEDAPTLLVDNDPNRSSTGWQARGGDGLPFRVVDVNQSLKVGRDFEHVVFDTKARPDGEELKTLAEGCDLLIIPTTPDALALEASIATVEILRALNVGRFQMLLTMVPSHPQRDGEDARVMLQAGGFPLFGGMVRDAKAFKIAALRGCLVGEVPGRRAAECWADYRRIGKEVVG